MLRLELDPAAVRGPLIAVLVGLLGCAATTYWAYNAWVADRRALAQARADLRAVQHRLDEAPDTVVYRRYAARFEAMRRRGWVGTSVQPGHQEALHALTPYGRPPHLRYQRGEPRHEPLGGRAGDKRGPALALMPARIELDALHEGQAITLLRRVAQQAPGLMVLRGCRLTRRRAPGEVALDGATPNVRAACRVTWVSARLAASGGDDA